MKHRRLVSKNGHPATYVTTKYVDSEKLLESFPSIFVQKLEALKTYPPVELQLNLKCNSVFTEFAHEFIQNLDNLQIFRRSSSWAEADLGLLQHPRWSVL